MGELPRSAWRWGRARGAAFTDLPAGLLARGRRRLARAALAAFGLIFATQALTLLWFLRVGNEVHPSALQRGLDGAIRLRRSPHSRLVARFTRSDGKEAVLTSG